MKKTIYLLLALCAVILFAGCPTEPVGPTEPVVITEFSFDGLDTKVSGTITGSEIDLNVPYGTDVSSLVATFITTGNDVFIDETLQESGVTLNDFSAPLTYTVSAFSADTVEYTVNVYITVNRAQLDTMIAADADVTRVDVSNITDMHGVFVNKTSFNQDISGWDVSNVTDMSSMFSRAASFNQDIGGWDVSNVTDINNMFNDADSFNQDIGDWDVSNVTNMLQLFIDCDSFNQDISGWDVSNVTEMLGVFSHAAAFNQDISSWNVSKVTNMVFMFNAAAAFNQNLSTWDVDYTDDDRTAAVFNTEFSTGWGGGTEPVWVP